MLNQNGMETYEMFESSKILLTAYFLCKRIRAKSEMASQSEHFSQKNAIWGNI